MALVGPITVSDENVIYTTSDVLMRIAKREVGKGILYITERAFIWKPNHREDGIAVPWPSISLHAISNNPERNIYLQLDFTLEWAGVFDPNQLPADDQRNNLNGAAAGDHVVEDEEIDEGNVSDTSETEGTEIHIVPQDSNTINQIFYAMNHCQSLHPDPNDSISEEDEDFMEAEGDNESDDNGQGGIRNINLDDENEDQFADAE